MNLGKGHIWILYTILATFLWVGIYSDKSEFISRQEFKISKAKMAPKVWRVKLTISYQDQWRKRRKTNHWCESYKRWHPYRASDISTWKALSSTRTTEQKDLHGPVSIEEIHPKIEYVLRKNTPRTSKNTGQLPRKPLLKSHRHLLLN